jgi:hypothetical protein
MAPTDTDVDGRKGTKSSVQSRREVGAGLVDRCEVLSETWEINVTAIKLRGIG